MTLPKKNAIGGNVVCEQWEWEAVEAIRPGYHTLLYAGIGTEQEAEKLARGTVDGHAPLGARKKTVVTPLFATHLPPARSPAPPRRRTGSRAA